MTPSGVVRSVSSHVEAAARALFFHLQSKHEPLCGAITFDVLYLARQFLRWVFTHDQQYQSLLETLLFGFNAKIIWVVIRHVRDDHKVLLIQTGYDLDDVAPDAPEDHIFLQYLSILIRPYLPLGL